MSIFNKRTTAPARDNRYFFNNQFNAFAGTRWAPPQVTGNCTWYAKGRFAEVMGMRANVNTGNATFWFGNNGGFPNRNDNYQRGQIPRLGAIVCWSGGSSGAGHVGVVEEIYPDGSYDISHSIWGGFAFELRRIRNNHYSNNHRFQGFIYNPVEFATNTPQTLQVFTPGTYKVNTAVLNVRRNPNTNGDNPPLKFNELTVNAQEQIRRLNNGAEANGLVRGVRATVSEVQGVLGRIPSGWISLEFCVRI